IDASGWSSEERKVCDETRKLLDLPTLVVSVTAVRVPVRTAHSEAVFLETERASSREELAAALEAAAGIVFNRDAIVTPRDVEGTDKVHVARLRCEDERHFALWCVGDQLRKGAATNAVEILELLLQKGYVAA
ncbi:MAG: Asd/ArgC dimerization domain-containing protein, partial [Candidatus Cybelea sp.]